MKDNSVLVGAVIIILIIAIFGAFTIHLITENHNQEIQLKEKCFEKTQNPDCLRLEWL